jgi:hypothetical protein
MSCCTAGYNDVASGHGTDKCLLVLTFYSWSNLVAFQSNTAPAQKLLMAWLNDDPTGNAAKILSKLKLE